MFKLFKLIVNNEGGFLGGLTAGAGALLGAGVSTLGGMFQSGQSFSHANKSRKFNRAEAEKARNFAHNEAQINRDWQEMMSNSAYQRQMEDMGKAGLNPMLVTGMSGATTPSGSQAGTSAASVGMGKAVNPLEGVVSSAKMGAMAGQELKNLKKQGQQLEKSIDNLESQSGKTRAEKEAQERENKIKEIDLKLYKSNPWLRKLQLMGNSASSLLSPVGMGVGAYGAIKALKGNKSEGYKGKSKAFKKSQGRTQKLKSAWEQMK